MYTQRKGEVPLEHYFTNNPYLKSEIKTITYEKENCRLSFKSDNSVFSKDKIDYGSSFLIDTFIKHNDIEIKTGLDVGCGYGLIGIVLNKKLNIKFDMIDVNRRAVHLTEMNIKENKADCRSFQSDIYSNVDKKYDLVITNPPIRAGKKVLEDILINAQNYLNSDGRLWFVMRRDHGVKSMQATLDSYYETEIVAKSKGFYVVKSKIR